MLEWHTDGCESMGTVASRLYFVGGIGDSLMNARNKQSWHRVQLKAQHMSAKVSTGGAVVIENEIIVFFP